MNAPLIVVQGDLLVPTLFPMASMPYAAYGEEWTLYTTRPPLTEYEIPFYAARFITAYISRLALPNDRFPYTPASLWGHFRRNDEMNAAVHVVADQPAQQPVIQTAQQPAPVAPVFEPALKAAPPVEPPVAPPPEKFEPYLDEEETRGAPPAPPSNNRRKQFAGGAIALACAAFIAWALFGTKPGHHGEPARPVQTAANPPDAAIKNEKRDDDTAGAPVSSSAAQVASASQVTPPAVAAAPAVAQKPATVAVAPKPDALASTLASATSRDHAETAPPVAKRVAPIVHTKTHLSAHERRELHRYEHKHRRHGYRSEPVYRSVDQGTLVSPGRRTLARQDYHSGASGVSGASNNGSPSIPEMYRMLAHSPVLDDNSSGARATTRSLPSLPRGSSGDGSNYSVELNQRRLTDAPSQFSR